MPYTTQAQVAIGSKLYFWDNSDWAQLTEVTGLSWDGPSREVIEIANLDNDDEYVEKLQGFLNSNSVGANISYTEAQFALLKAQMETRGLQMYAIELPNGEALEFEGFLTAIPMEMSGDAQIQGEVTFEVSGKMDFVSALS